MIFVKAISKYLAIIGALWMSIPLQGVADEQLVINFAEKFVNHEISVSDLKKFDNNFSATFVDLINKSKALKTLRRVRNSYVDAAQVKLYAYHRPTFRQMLVLVCHLERPESCANSVNRHLHTYSKDLLDIGNIPKEVSLEDLSREIFWGVETLIQRVLRESEADTLNKGRFLDYFWDEELFTLRDMEHLENIEPAIIELSRIRFGLTSDRESRLRSGRRSIILKKFLNLIENQPLKYQLALDIIEGEVKSNEFSIFTDLDSLIQKLLEPSVHIDRYTQYSVLVQLTERYSWNWPFVISRPQFLQGLDLLVATCRQARDSCDELRALHSAKRFGNYAELGDHDTARLKLIEALRDFPRGAGPLEVFVKKVVPITIEIGEARSRGDLAEVIRKSESIRPIVKASRYDNRMKESFVLLGQYELMFIKDDFSIGRSSKAIADAKDLLAWVRGIPATKSNTEDKNNLLVDIDGFLYRSRGRVQTSDSTPEKTEAEIHRETWISGISLGDKIRLLRSYFHEGDLAEARQLFLELVEYYDKLKRNHLITPSISLENALSIFKRALDAKDPKQLFTQQELLILQNLTVTSIFESVSSLETITAGFKQWADNYESRSPALARFFAKLFINTVHENLDNLDSKLGKKQHNFSSRHDLFIKKFASHMLSINDFQSAYGALTALQDFEHHEYINRKESINKRVPLTLDSVESKFNVFLQRTLSEVRILSREFARTRGAKTAEKTLSQIQALETNLLKEFIKFEKNASASPPKKALLVPANQKAPVILISSLTSFIEVFGRYQGRSASIRIPVTQRELRESAFHDYVALTKAGSSVGQSHKTRLTLGATIAALTHQLKIPPKSEILIQLDDALHMLPDVALIDETVLNAYTFPRAVSSVQRKSSQFEKRSGAFFFGASNVKNARAALPFVREEESAFRAAHERVGVRAVSFIDGLYTKERLEMALFKDGRVVHIASHFLLQGNSLGTSQLLLGDGAQISAADLLGDSRAMHGVSLVTLAACETGITQEVFSESSKGFRGLGTELIRRGADEVIASLWRIEDKSTSVFFRIFYDIKLSGKLSAADALRETQRIFSGHSKLNGVQVEMLTRALGSNYGRILKEMEHPYHWAGFIAYRSLD